MTRRFPVVIDPSLSVGHLKKAIKDKSATTITCDADELELFLAKPGDTWLTDAGASAVTLNERGYPQTVGSMDPSLSLNNAKYFGEKFQLGEGQVHVLVAVPQRQTVVVYVPAGGSTSAVQQEVQQGAPDVIGCGISGSMGGGGGL
ncbi:hypothetical protein PC121_g7492 [Phytophthora cactorum]|nr:hypothetical protein PC121_g7492 [Phytophthora cactorum]